VREALYLHLQAETRNPAEYLVYPKRQRTRPFSPAGIDGWFRRCCDRAGVAGYTMHQLRKAAADDIHRGSGSIYNAKELLRHKSVATTEIYLNSGVDDLRYAIEQLSSSPPHEKD
jgi:integrase